MVSDESVEAVAIDRESHPFKERNVKGLSIVEDEFDVRVLQKVVKELSTEPYIRQTSSCSSFSSTEPEEDAVVVTESAEAGNGDVVPGALNINGDRSPPSVCIAESKPPILEYRFARTFTCPWSEFRDVWC